MNLLIVTPYYEQSREIGSVRWTNIAQRLAKRHNVIVVTQPLDETDMHFSKAAEKGLAVVRLNQKTRYEKFSIKFFHGITEADWKIPNKLDESKLVCDNSLSKDTFTRKIKNRLLYRSAKAKAKRYAREIIKRVIPKDTRIDVVISSACPFIEMLFGYELKKRLGCKWICDFRDLPFIDDNCDDTHIQKAIMQRVLKDADAITVVTNSMQTELSGWGGINTDVVKIIPNGFSVNDYREPKTIKDKVLYIAHTGSLYGGALQADMLFRAIQLLKDKDPDFMISVETAGGNNTSILETADKYQLRSCVKDLGFIPRDKALDLQSESDYLLAIIRNIPGKGFAAKLFEYLLNRKNIICLITDGYYEKTDAEVFIEKLNIGIVVKETDGDEAVRKLADYLLEGRKRKISGLEPDYKPNLDEIQQYNHDNIAIQVEKLCQSIN